MTNISSDNSRRAKCTLAALLAGVILVLLAGCVPSSSWTPVLPLPLSTWTPALTEHYVDALTGFEEAWLRPDVFAIYDWTKPQLSAVNGQVVFLGSVTPDEGIGVFALDARNGDILWAVYRERPRAIYTMQDSLYIGGTYAGKARVTNYDLESGEAIWEKRFDTNSVLYLSGDEGTVSAYINPDIFAQLNAANGRTVKTYRTEDTVFLRTDHVTYIRQPYLNTLSAYQTNTGNLIWDAAFDRPVNQSPVFTDDMIYVRTDKALGRVYALERDTGETLWVTDRNVVSNVAATESTVFFLTEDGLLVEYNEQTGEIVAKVEFTNAPFLLVGDTEAGGYHVAYDEKTDQVFAVLGDSRQLFAFRVGDG